MSRTSDKSRGAEMKTVRVRIAPSPTGFFHIGTARTALFNYLFARKHGGVFVVRVEDTDLERSDPAFEKDILEGLAWLGIEGDESPLVGGPYAPYRQSERIETYTPHIQKLLEAGSAYWCYHSEEDLLAIKQNQIAQGDPQRYPGLCRDAKVREEQKNKGGRGVIRFAVPAGRTIAFDDLVRGRIEFESDLMGDFSIAKDEKTPLYNFAVVVDDATMAITHVIRGEDHVSNTPRQLLIAEALGFTPPAFAHLPLILGPDRSKLSKRHGATSLREYRKQGYLKEAMVNFMALLGWSPQAQNGGTDQEVFSKEELAELFSIEKVQKSGAVFNIAKLDSLNSIHMRRLAPEELTRRAIPFLVDAGLLTSPEEVSFEWLVKVIALERERIKKLGDLPEAVRFIFETPSYDKKLLRWKTMKSDEEAREALKKVSGALGAIPEGEWTQDIIASRVKDVAQGDNGRYFWPLRAALSGREKSPGPQEIAEVLGKEKTLQRIEDAENLLG